jgi:Flp pilus assembly protein TadB
MVSDVTKLRERVESFLSKVDARCSALISLRKQKLDELGKQERILDKQVALAEEQQQAKKEGEQAAIDTKLVWAVFLMIAAIVAMFLTLRVFPESLATIIVTERTAIELLSMGFLLLTVIILGTGKVVKGDALGPILGAIAGYIFGRKEGGKPS